MRWELSSINFAGDSTHSILLLQRYLYTVPREAFYVMYVGGDGDPEGNRRITKHLSRQSPRFSLTTKRRSF